MKQIGKQVPIISFQGRCKSASVHKTPGPGTYNTISDNVFKYKTPAWTMAPRTNLGTDHRTMPGPGSHSPEKVTYPFLIHLKKKICVLVVTVTIGL